MSIFASFLRQDAELTRVHRYQRTESKASVYDLESLKDFMRKVAYGIDGEDAEDREFDVPGWETVRKYWNAFTAAWQRAYPLQSIPRGLA